MCPLMSMPELRYSGSVPEVNLNIKDILVTVISPGGRRGHEAVAKIAWFGLMDKAGVALSMHTIILKAENSQLCMVMGKITFGWLPGPCSGNVNRFCPCAVCFIIGPNSNSDYLNIITLCHFVCQSLRQGTVNAIALVAGTWFPAWPETRSGLWTSLSWMWSIFYREYFLKHLLCPPLSLSVQYCKCTVWDNWLKMTLLRPWLTSETLPPLWLRWDI